MAKQIIHANHTGVTFTVVGEELRGAVTIVGVPEGVSGDVGKRPTLIAPGVYELQTPQSSLPESIAGGGFVNVSGHVALDLGEGHRSFHHTLTAALLSLAFTNVPDGAEWRWALTIDANGPHGAEGFPSVDWIDGGTWATNLNLAANARNVIAFTQIGASTYAALIRNGRLQLDDLFYFFPASDTVSIKIRTPVTIDVANAIVEGAGTVTYWQGATQITTATLLQAGQMFHVTAAAGQSVTVPRYLT